MANPRSASGQANHSFRALLSNRAFRSLWIAQLLSQTAHNGIHYVELLMIARLTNSTGHVGLMILAFTTPAVLFSAIAGVVVDRLPKRRILVGSNLIRIVTALSYVAALQFLSGRPLLIWVYSVTFIASAIAQFFAPAEGATIPMLVGRERLITANSLFNLTITGTQVVGLLVLFPLIIKVGDRFFGFGIEASFVLVAVMYAVAAWLLTRLPRDPVLARARRGATELTESTIGRVVQRSWGELKEGLRFVGNTRSLWVPMINLSSTATIAMILAMMAPQFASDILQVSQEDAIYIFAPAGIGMLLGTFTIPRVAHRFRRENLSNSGIVLQGLMLALLAILARAGHGATGLTVATMALSLGIGLGFALIGIPAQTMLQERAPHEIRGRVYSVQYLLANLVSIPPMLFAGTVADRVGIPPVIFATGMLMLLLGGLAIWVASRYRVGPPRIVGAPLPTDGAPAASEEPAGAGPSPGS